MCNSHCIDFGKRKLSWDEIHDKRVIEIGAYNVNGSLRSVIERYRPAEYIGVDIVKGYGVDIVCSAEDVRKKFGDERFDIVVSTEMMEHVRDWRQVVSNMKNLCRPNGIVFITTRSIGFEYHGYPYDFWRYEPSDMEQIFSDFSIQAIESDTGELGVFIKAKKPSTFKEQDLSSVALYSIITGTRIRDIDDNTVQGFQQNNGHKYSHPERRSLKKRAKQFFRDLFWRIKACF